MPRLRFRLRLLDSLARTANGAGELGLAFLMTVGVVHCGGSTDPGPRGEHTTDGSVDAAGDGPLTVVEAPFPAQDGGDGPLWIVEAPVPAPDAAADADATLVIVEAPFPVPEAGGDATHPMIEAPVPAPEAGGDVIHPMIEAPIPAPEAGLDEQ
jgi:hypothetical protein